MEEKQLNENGMRLWKTLFCKSREGINANFDVPYTAGYSTDGQIIYIDRKLPRYFKTTEDVTCDVWKYLIIHETTEKSNMDKLGLTYNEAHQLALGAEERALENDRVSVDEYYGFLGPWIEFNKKPENFSFTPPDLDLRPYQEDKMSNVLQKIQIIRGQ